MQKDTEEVKELKFFSINELPLKISPPEVPIIRLFIDSISK
jgi:hypothetical protein